MTILSEKNWQTPLFFPFIENYSEDYYQEEILTPLNEYSREILSSITNSEAQDTGYDEITTIGILMANIAVQRAGGSLNILGAIDTYPNDYRAYLNNVTSLLNKISVKATYNYNDINGNDKLLGSSKKGSWRYFSSSELSFLGIKGGFYVSPEAYSVLTELITDRTKFKEIYEGKFSLLNSTQSSYNAKPTASVSLSNQTINLGESVTIDGSQSTNSEGSSSSLSYLWTITLGSQTIATKTTSAYTLTPQAAGTYAINLKVEEGALVDIDEDTLTVVEATETTTNTAPTPSFKFLSSNYKKGDKVKAVSTSTDNENDTLTYSWKVYKGSGTVVNSSSSSRMSFTASDTGSYTVTLTVSDGTYSKT